MRPFKSRCAADDRRIPFDTVVKNRGDANSLQIFVKHHSMPGGHAAHKRGDQRRGAITARQVTTGV